MTDKKVVTTDADEPDRPDFAARLARFVKKYHRKLERQLSRRMPPHAADDVLQNAYENLLTKPPQPGTISDFRKYFGGILQYGVVNWFRQEQSQQRRAEEELLRVALEGVPVEMPSAEACALMAQIVEAQLAVLGNEAPQALRAFQLVRLDGLTAERAAQRMGLSRHQVSRLVCRVLLRLKSVYELGEPK